MMSPEYAAGFFDADGSVSIDPRERVLRVDISNTHRGVLEQFHHQFGGFISTFNQREQHHKPVHHWRMKCGPAEEFLRLIAPHVVVKKDRVELALRVREMGGRRTGPWPGGELPPDEAEFRAKQERLIDDLRRLNQRGLVAA